MKRILSALLIIALITGCSSWNNQQKGTAAGAAGGALLGAAVSKGSIWGVLAGAAIGGTAGNLIGKHMDKQARELEQAVPTASVDRVDEGINMTFDASLAFQINSADLSESYKDDLRAAAEVFKKYEDTNILIEGHTDDSGSAEYNMDLSERRAKASINALVDDFGIDASRLEAVGKGKTNLVSKRNDINRRVEFQVVR